MCHLAVKAICFALLTGFALVNAEVTIENGGYSVLVTFSQNVNSAKGLALLEKAKESLGEASTILHNAIGLQFTKVTFKIPDSWDISQMNININAASVSRRTKADFLIDGADDVVFGKFPFAQQYGGCGVPGHQIIIPTAFFSDANTFPKGTALAREWLKYRYGVFDENGYERDTLYPLYYSHPMGDTQLKVTDCTNSPVTYDITDQSVIPFTENDELRLDSRVVPDAESLKNVTSSVMYFHQDIPGMQHVCGKDSDHPHNALSPNKHNALCRSQSVWEVVKKSADFREGTVPKEYSDIEFIYAQAKKLKVVVAWENTARINDTITMNKGDIILNAIKRFVYELPRGTKFNGFPFSDTLSDDKDYTLREMNDLKDKNGVMPNIKSDFGEPTNGNLNIAGFKALDILAPEPEGTIIIISRSSEALDKTLLERLRKAEVCVELLRLGGKNASHKTEHSTPDLPCVFQEDISDDNSERMFNQLFASMEKNLPSTIDDRITETVKTGYISRDAPITLRVDETVERVTFWLSTTREHKNFEMKFDQVNEKLEGMNTADVVVALSFYPRKAGSIEFAYRFPKEPLFTQIRVTSKAGKYLNGHILTQDTTTDTSSPQQMPVIIYAVIRYGAYPVQNAKVKATVEKPDGTSVTLEMFDDGRGDPDITLNDGVYSRYFTQFNEGGVYSVGVKVEVADLTSYGVDRNAEYRTCCGSTLETAQSKIPESNKEFKSNFVAISGRPEQGYKPSRITDLTVDSVLDDKIVLKWTAPGEECDSGTVHSYEIKLYTSHEDAMKGETGMTLNYPITPLERGGTQTLEMKLTDFKEPGRYYVTISAKNENNQNGDASTILEIYIPDKQATTTPDNDTTSDDGSSSKMGGAEKKRALIIGLVVGVIVLIILIILAVYCVVVKSKLKEEAKANPPTSDATERGENNAINPISFISADTLIRHHNEKTLARMENKEPPIFREEDFDDTDSAQTSESRDNNNTREAEGFNKRTNNEVHLPPKSPKKTTYV